MSQRFIGTTDASSLLGDNPNNVDLAIVGPGITIMAHQVDEYIEKDMYLKYIDIYKDVAVKYLGKVILNIKRDVARTFIP